MNAPQDWYRASDGNWYYGQHPQPYSAPPEPDGRGGWTAAVPAASPAAPSANDGWVRRHKKLSTAGAVLAAFVVVGAVAGDGTDDTRGVRTVSDGAPSQPASTTPAVVPTTVPPRTQPPTTAPATTPPPRRTTAPSPVATAPVRTTPRPAATRAAAKTCGAPANPWGYHFCGGGSVITAAPAAFCDYFDCIANFWNRTEGYVMQCEDGTFGHSGGRSGSCSHHDGNYRPLYR